MRFGAAHRKLWRSASCFAILLGLLVAGCGGGGGGGSAATTVTVAPSSITIVLNGTQQFTANVTGEAKAATITSNGAVRASNVVTITTTSAHGFTQGQTVVVSGVTDASFGGTFIIASVPSTTTFTYSQTGPDATSGNGSVFNNNVKWFVNDVGGGNATLGTITTGGLYTAPAALPPPTTATIAATGAVRASNTVTITTTATHSFVVGQTVVISGVTDTSFNGTFSIATVPSGTTFTYPQTGANATSGGGTVSSFAVKVKAVSSADNTTSATAVVSIDSGIQVRVTPTSATVGTSENLQFIATVAGSSNTAVKWFVNDIEGGNTTLGTISTNGLYTAPATPPNVTPVTIAANGAVRSSNTVTITTTAAHGFVAGQSVVIAGVTDSSFNGTFTIATVPSTTTFTYAQTGSNATSSGGTATAAAATITIKVTSTADASRSASALTSIVTAADPTLTSISPAQAAQGSLFQDVYLMGTNFISTTKVFFNGTLVDTSRITAVSGTLLRVRLPDSVLATATPPAGVPITVQSQRGTPANPTPQPFRILAVRPALVGATPDSGTQGGGGFNFNVNGGYFGAAGPPPSPAVKVEFDGSVHSATINSARQLSVAIGGMDLCTPGLFSVAVRNTAVAQLVAVTNFAVQPGLSATGGCPPVTPPSLVGSPLPVGTQPAAVAVNTATGIAVVANRGSNNISLIDLGAATPAVVGTPIAVGTAPTGVAIDNARNLAVVANNNPGGGGSVSVVNLAATPPTITSTITANIGNGPVSVGVNPLTGLGLVAYASTNNASIIDLNATPPAVVSTVTISTGANPQVAIEPRLNWAVVSPGGAGTLSIVDLGRRITSTIAANGAARSANVVTITTTAAHGLITGQVVLIQGVTPDTSFNGVFTVASVPSATTFTYTQTASSATSGGGTVTFTPPLATVAVGANTRAIAINPETEKALLADPASPALVFFSVLDQATTSLTLSDGTGPVAAAVNPLTDVGLTINPNTNQASLIDPRTPTRLTTISLTGTGPKAVAIDPGTNRALVVNETSNNVTVLSLGDIRPLHITQLVLPASRQLTPAATLTSATDLPLTVLGKGFVAGSVVRLDGTPLPTPSSVSDRQISVTVPASFLVGPRHYALDVLNPGGVHSNVTDLTVVQPVDVTSTGCTAPAPRAVAIDSEHNLAVVTNTGCQSVSLIDLTTGTVTKTVAVGTNPQGVAIISRLGTKGKATVTNRGDNTATIIDLSDGTVCGTCTVTVGTEPIGVAINADTATAIVANSGSNDLIVFSADTGGTATPPVATDQRPVAVAIDPVQSIAAVANAQQNAVTLYNLSQTTLVPKASLAGPQLPTAVVLDPVSGLFLVTSSLSNSFLTVDPTTQQGQFVRIGINPTSMAYNFQSGTLVTVNSASNTVSVMDFLDRRVRAVFGSGIAPACAALLGPNKNQQPPCGVEIHPRTNLAVIVDGDNNRVLLVPLPR